MESFETNLKVQKPSFWHQVLFDASRKSQSACNLDGWACGWFSTWIKIVVASDLLTWAMPIKKCIHWILSWVSKLRLLSDCSKLPRWLMRIHRRPTHWWQEKTNCLQYRSRSEWLRIQTRRADNSDERSSSFDWRSLHAWLWIENFLNLWLQECKDWHF